MREFICTKTIMSNHPKSVVLFKADVIYELTNNGMKSELGTYINTDYFRGWSKRNEHPRFKYLTEVT